ncbi:hypothetical protein [uncultured Parabacteroides sp.]|uniref:hypothetical protein n=1 Tax=uncultured Parabacteroides sp. TaxID=512312 RepID=UPI0026593303|nr:hypothetical protein [uncultured Parabacteroides sp.]
MNKIYLASFADTRMSPTLKRLGKEAKDSCFFNGIFLYDESLFLENFKQQFADKLILGSRGYGYWVWKPYVILETLRKLPNNSILLYVDAGCHINNKGHELLKLFVKRVANSESGLLISELSKTCLERYYSKGDLLDYFNVRNNKNIVDTPQRQAGVIFIRKEAKNMELIRSWLDLFSFNFHLIDDTPSMSFNLDGFIENRHDQSAFSILTKLRGAELFPAELLSKDIQHPIWALRDKKMKLKYQYSFKRFLKKMAQKICRQ